MVQKQNNLKIMLAQINVLLGDIEGNTQKIITIAQQALQQHCDMVVFPELALTGYPPEDLLLRDELHQRVEQAITKLCKNNSDVMMIVGHPHAADGEIYNAASVISQGKIIAQYFKQHLPNYSVFDEKRYFQAGDKPCVIDCKGQRIGITICEDLWQPGPLSQAVAAGAESIVCLNASPFHINKLDERIAVLRARQVDERHVPILYLNCVGGQDELVFDGHSFVLDGQGKLCQLAPAYEESLEVVELPLSKKTIAKPLSEAASLYQALVLGTRDYIVKNNFTNALVGLSGGIDSALSLAIAADAIGAEHIQAVYMPSRYSAAISGQAARQMANSLGINYTEIPIEDVFNSFLSSLKNEFAGLAADVTEENIQSRCRGTLLMALSNKTGRLLLTTGNKSEMAVGYATLYGDMAGGFAILKDVLKTKVYELARYRNQLEAVIPQIVLDRPPSAELAEAQTDQDSLPAYDILDPIIMRYVEDDESIDAIVQAGFDRKIVERVVQMIHRNEFKRRQAAPGVRITARAFGRDWRYPITQGFSKQP